MSNADLFIERFKELESTVRGVFGISESNSVTYYLAGRRQYKQYREELVYCQQVRNLLQHKEKINGSFAVEPSSEMLAFIDTIIKKLKAGPKCIDIAVKLNDIHFRRLSDNVKNSISFMRKTDCNHIPILEKGKVIGLFDENVVFNYFTDHINSVISDKLCFYDIKSYLSLDKRYRDNYIFMSADSYVDELEEIFENTYRKGQRVVMVFITETGNSLQPLIGLISPWDILGKA